MPLQPTRNPDAPAGGIPPRELTTSLPTPARPAADPGEPEFCLVLDDQLVLLACNDAFARWLGHDRPERLLHRPLAETLDDPAQLAPLWRALERVDLDSGRDEGVLRRIDLDHRDRHGRLALARYHLLAPGSIGPEQRRLVVLGSDRRRSAGLLEEMIALKRERETQLARYRELNRRLVRQGTDLNAFTHMVNHDLTNALNAVGLIAALLARRPAQEPERIVEACEDIQELCHHMAGALRGFVTLADQGHARHKPAAVALEPVARGVAAMVAAQHPEVAHDVRLAFEAEKAWVDPNHLSQILENLVTNAFKYRDPARPTLELTLSSRRRFDRVILEVADNAIGIPAEQAARVFDLFARAHPDTAPGLGIGLTIVKRLVEINGGEIELESTPGQGSTFRISLPTQPHPADLAGD